MTAKEYLSQLREVKRQQRILQDEINELMVKAGYGTEQNIAIHHIITKGTIDEQTMKSLQRKDKTQAALIEAIKAQLRWWGE